MVFQSSSPDETKKFALDLAEKFKNKHAVIALSGDLGAGKTTFTQGFARGLGIDDKIISPTFVIIRQHPYENNTRIFYHIDLYRLEGKIDISSLGIKEMFEDKNALILI